jgi:CBS domain-containing protein
MSKLRDVMTAHPVALDSRDSCAFAARKMAESDIGDVIVQEKDGRVCGILTDRDIVVRAVAKERDPAKTPIGEVCTRDVVSLSPDDDIETALRLMKSRAIRRVPVVDNGRAVGIVSLGDLAQDRAPDSVLGKVSAAPPNN